MNNKPYLNRCWLLVSFLIVFGCSESKKPEDSEEVTENEVSQEESIEQDNVGQNADSKGDESTSIEGLNKEEVKAKDQSGYLPSIVPENMTVAEKKKRFRALLIPAIDDVYADLSKQYEELKKIIERGETNERIAKLKVSYKVESDLDLLKAIKPHPKSIALAQAAMESAWGTSRFFVKANNIFGVWSFDKSEPRIAASEKRGDKTIWVKKYASVEAAVSDYYRVLGRGSAFKEFRTTKMENPDPYVLVTKLDRYSEKGDEYGKELAAMIRFNKFDKFDQTQE
jgi:Bax protein